MPASQQARIDAEESPRPESRLLALCTELLTSPYRSNVKRLRRHSAALGLFFAHIALSPQSTRSRNNLCHISADLDLRRVVRTEGAAISDAKKNATMESLTMD